MYKIVIINNGNQTLVHYPSANDKVPHLFKADLDEKESQISQLTLDIPIFSPGYSLIKDRTTLVQVISAADNVIVWRGRIINTQEHMDNNSNPFFKESICEDELGFMCDTQTRPQTITAMLPYDFLTLVINNHNSHTTSDKQFILGTVEMTAPVTCTLNFDTTLNTILTNLVNVQGGRIALRYGINGTRYLDYLSTDGNTNNVEIALGKNQVDLINDPDVTNIATRLIPVGKDNLTITTVNGGKDYLENIDASNQYGVVEQIVSFSDITDPTALMVAGQAELDQASKAQVKLQLDVLDLSTIGLDANSFFVSDNVHVTNTAINFDDTFRVIEKTTDLIQPQNIKLTFDNKFERLADKQVALQRSANFVNQISDNGGVNSYYLRNAIDATKNNIVASGAYKNKKYIEGEGFLLENTDITDSGYGAMYLGGTGLMIANTKDSSGNWVWTTFGTGAGFTADLIIAGTMIADRIKAGTLSSLDGSFSLSLDNGHMITKDNLQSALDFYKESISFYDYLNTGLLIGVISSTRQIVSGNPTGSPALKLTAMAGSSVLISVSNTAGDDTAIEVSNNAYSDGQKIYFHKPIVVDNLATYTGYVSMGSANKAYWVENGLITTYGL